MKILTLLARLYRWFFPVRFLLPASTVDDLATPLEVAQLVAQANPTGLPVTADTETNLDKLQAHLLDMARIRPSRAVRRARGARKCRTQYLESLPKTDR